METVLLNEIIKNVCKQFTNEAKDKGIAIIFTEKGAFTICADSRRIEQVFYNLITNALKYTAAGGHIELTIQASGDEVQASVADTGTGIDAGELPLIFSRFYRADKSRSRETGGAGLGLAIAKGFVEAHGGKIWVESQLGSGSRFIFVSYLLCIRERSWYLLIRPQRLIPKS